MRGTGRLQQDLMPVFPWRPVGRSLALAGGRFPGGAPWRGGLFIRGGCRSGGKAERGRIRDGLRGDRPLCLPQADLLRASLRVAELNEMSCPRRSGRL